jgi:hypothetical protein
MKTTYRILINDKQDAEGRNISMADGYTPGDPLTLAWSATEDFNQTELMPCLSEKEICEILFERFNIEHPEGYRNRSLSVGDVVTLEYVEVVQPHKVLRHVNKAYAVDRVGFVEIPLPSLVTDSMESVMSAAVRRMRGNR